MADIRLSRLRAQQRHERARALRLLRAVTTVAVVAAVVVLPLRAASPPPQDPDVVLGRLATSAREQPDDRAANPGHEEPSGATTDATAPRVEVVRLTGSPDMFVPIAELVVPRIGLEAPVYSGVQSGILEIGVGQWPGTGQHRVLSGHRTTYHAPFRDLDLLAAGDDVLLHMGSRPPQRFAVYETAIVAEQDYVDHVLATPADPDVPTITMFACHPKGSRSQRIVVRARAAGTDVPPPAPDPFRNA